MIPHSVVITCSKYNLVAYKDDNQSNKSNTKIWHAYRLGPLILVFTSLISLIFYFAAINK